MIKNKNKRVNYRVNVLKTTNKLNFITNIDSIGYFPRFWTPNKDANKRASDQETLGTIQTHYYCICAKQPQFQYLNQILPPTECLRPLFTKAGVMEDLLSEPVLPNVSWSFFDCSLHHFLYGRKEIFAHLLQVFCMFCCFCGDTYNESSLPVS